MRYVHGVLHIGGLPAPELVRRFGSPLFVYDAEILERQISRLRAAMPQRVKAAYALKANSNLSLLKIIGRHGLHFDAVSPGEIFLLEHCGFLGERVWFTCANTSADDFRSVADPDLIINLNGMSELDLYLASGLQNRLSLRVNPDVGAGHHRDVVTGGFGVKFGFDVAELEEAVKIVRHHDRELVGIHAHIGSGVNDIEPLIASARRLVYLAEEIGGLTYLNFGGGFSTPYRPGDEEFPIDSYGAALGDMIGEILERKSMQGIVEPGRYVVAECGTLLTTATAKHVSGGYEWIGCDTGFNHLARPSKYGAYHHVLNASRGEDGDLRENAGSPDGGESVLAGNICESGDVFTRSVEGIEPRKLPRIRVGDVLAICDVGAYGFSMASHYNARLLPPEVLVRGNDVTLIRERQKFSHLLEGQILCE